MDFLDLDHTQLDIWLGKDLPLRLCFEVRNKSVIEQRFLDIGLPAVKKRWMFTRMALLAELARAFPTGRRTSYSRSKPWYIGKSTYYRVPFSLSIITGIIDQAEMFGLVDNEIAERRSFRQSTVRATQKLVDLFTDADMDFVQHGVLRLTKPELVTQDKLEIWVRRNKKNAYRTYKPKTRLISFEETDETKRIEQDVNTINAGLAAARLECPGLFDQDEKYINNIGSFLEFD